MPVLRLIAVAAVVAAFAAGCGDPPNCEQSAAKVGKLLGTHNLAPLVDQCKSERWSDEMRSCIKAASSAATLDHCRPTRNPLDPGAYLEYMKKSKKSEAELQLSFIKKSLRAQWAEQAQLPKGHVGPTPAAGSCCSHQPDFKCPPDPTLWQDPVWQALDYVMDEPAYYSYEYESTDGVSATVRAIGDLDCDGTLATYELHCESVAGDLNCDLSSPAQAD